MACCWMFGVCLLGVGCAFCADRCLMLFGWSMCLIVYCLLRVGC